MMTAHRTFGPGESPIDIIKEFFKQGSNSNLSLADSKSILEQKALNIYQGDTMLSSGKVTKKASVLHDVPTEIVHVQSLEVHDNISHS